MRCYMTADTTVLSTLVRHMFGGSIGMAPAACQISHLGRDEATPATQHLIGTNPIESTFLLRG